MSEKKILTAADILSAEDIKTNDIEVPEWGGSIRIRSLSASEAIKFVADFGDAKGGENVSSVEIVALCAVGEDGKRLFTREQVKELHKKSFRAIMRIQEEALRINGMKEDAPEQAKND